MTIHNMQFRIIRTALNHMGKVIHARDLTPRSRERWYCCSCNNPLRLRWTHDSGGYFEHDLEEAEELKLRQCEYQAIPQEKPVSAFEQAVNALMERDDTPSTGPSKKDYFCVLCQREYYGFRCCPECRQHIYSTEMKLFDLLTVPEKFAK
ncbi:zinc-ribbon domain-containing protein [Cronobacter sakazakii]|uniref:zinc-ribbon domain-containing protein n=1 Tax=Cronobacter sakazakii TaxID=28141 RepID=UPI001F2CB304|nr:zinc-ribbon domain-containing protein [Cronobacter sakazakii]